MSQDEELKDTPHMHIELDAESGKTPVRLSMGLYVLIQIVLGVFFFGVSYASTSWEIKSLKQEVGEMKEYRTDFMAFQSHILVELQKNTSTLQYLQEEVRNLRNERRK
jgi:TRAP-type mannitol/chloroaromatic compound transport system permease small subunit